MFVFALLPAALAAQTIATVTAELSTGARRIIITGQGFSQSDEVTVAGVECEKIQVTATRIEAAMPAGITLMGGEYVVKVTGKESARGTLRIASGQR